MRIKLRITVHILVLAILVLGSSGLTFQSTDNGIQKSSVSDVEISYSQRDSEDLIQNSDMDGANPLNQIELQVFAANWELLSPTGAPEGRKVMPLVYDSVNRKTILFGGLAATGNLADTWVYDQPTNTWTEVTPLSSPSQRNGHAMVFDPVTRKVIMFGGSTGGTETWTYDYKTNTWTPVTPSTSPSGRLLHTMVYDSVNQVVLLYGGQSGETDTWAYDPVFNTWTDLAPATNPGARFGPYYSFDQASGKFILFGGFVATGNLVDTWAYDYAANTWTDLNSVNEPSPPRTLGKGMVYDPIIQKSVLFGGIASVLLDETWVFDYASNSWSQLTPASDPGIRTSHGMAYDSGAQVIILFGGDDGSFKDDTWQYTPHEFVFVNWGLLSPTGSPEARRGTPLVYDSANRKTILFSGFPADADTWVYDQPTNTWTEVTPLSSPSQRWGHKMVYDPVTEKVIMFGGTSGGSETWTYNYKTNTWTEVTPSVSPSARRGHTLVYDTVNQVVLMQGGYSGSFALADTWVYDPVVNTWTNLAPATNPGAREAAYYSFDQASGKFIIFGGSLGAGNVGDTWSYDFISNTWTDLNSLNEPSARLGSGSGMVYDPIIQK